MEATQPLLLSFSRSMGSVGFLFTVTGFLILLAITLCLIVLSKLRSAAWDNRKIPGPWFQLPIVGYMPFLGSKPYIKMWQLSRRYGPVFQFRMGNRQAVVLNGADTIKAAFLHNAEAFAGRPDFKSFKFFSWGKSLTFLTYSPSWCVHRKAASRVLSTFVDNRRYPIDSLLYDQGVLLANTLTATTNSVYPQKHIENCVVNVTYKLCFGRDGDPSNSGKKMMLQMLHSVRDVMTLARLNDILPSCLTWTLQKPLKTFQRGLKKFDDIVSHRIEQLLSNDGGYKPGSPRCITDALQDVWNEQHEPEVEAEDRSTNSVDGSGLSRDQLVATVQDLIGAGHETLANFVNWSILYMAKYPDIQARLRMEVESKIGTSRAPTSADRLAMPFVESFMWEVVRHSSLVPLALPHATVRDVVFKGMLIPKNTLVLANIYSTGVDPAVWKNPEEFQPDRMLDSKGDIDRDLLDQFLCFSIGRRKCLGAELGRRAMFIILTVLVQKCKFEPESGQTALTLDSKFLLTSIPKPYLVKVTAAGHI